MIYSGFIEFKTPQKLSETPLGSEAFFTESKGLMISFTGSSCDEDKALADFYKANIATFKKSMLVGISEQQPYFFVYQGRSYNEHHKADIEQHSASFIETLSLSSSGRNTLKTHLGENYNKCLFNLNNKAYKNLYQH